jgi:hypothetical protein
MPRRSALAGIIFCPANLATMQTLVTESGLHVEPANELHHYRLTSRSRLPQPDLLQDFLDIVEGQLDEAVASRKIEAWWPIAHGDAQFRRMEARNPTRKRFD